MPEMKSGDVKALIYDQIGLRPELQRIEYKYDDEMFDFEKNQTLEDIEMWSDDALYLKSIAYCP